MSRLDGDVRKTSSNILHTLNESVASVKSQIKKDAPEDASTETKEALIKKVQNNKVPSKTVKLTETEDIKSVQDKIAELQDYLNNTPEIAEDERASIQAEIDELLDEVNYYEAGANIEESSLTEAPNPENEKINKMIMNTVKTNLKDTPKYKKELEDLGLSVEPNSDFDCWIIKGPNGNYINKYSFLGGQHARFNSKSKKAVDYYNLLTKDKGDRWSGEREYRLNKPSNTKAYDGKTNYGHKYYNNRQQNSQGYNFNDLRNGTKDIHDYKGADADLAYAKRDIKYYTREANRAQEDYDDFMANIESQIQHLKSKIDEHKKSINSAQRDYKDAEKMKKDIIDRKRAQHNKEESVKEESSLNESYTAREDFEAGLKKYKEKGKNTDNIKVIAETEMYLVTISAGGDGIEMYTNVFMGSDDDVKLPNIYIKENYRGKIEDVAINWAALGNRPLEDTEKFANYLMQAVQIAKEIEGKDYSYIFNEGGNENE